MTRRHGFGLAAYLPLLVVFIATPVKAQAPRARTLLYDQQRKEWVEPTPPQIGTAEGDLHDVRLMVSHKDYHTALRAIKRFKQQHGSGDPNYPESLLLEAQAQIGLKEFDKAHAACQAFLNEFSGMRL